MLRVWLQVHQTGTESIGYLQCLSELTVNECNVHYPTSYRHPFHHISTDYLFFSHRICSSALIPYVISTKDRFSLLTSPFCVQAHLRRHSQIHNRVENYNPRQRKLRNLIVEDENAPTTCTPPAGQDTADEQARLGVVENVEHPDSGASVKEGEQEGFGMEDMMEVLVTDTFPVQSHLVVELQEDGADVKA